MHSAPATASGLFVRFLGFILIGYNSEALIFTGVFLIGIGGSQYESGTYGYLAKVNKVRSDAFYLNNQALNLGVIIGPLIAFFIPHQGYGSFFLSSALAFLTLAIINSFAFPADDKHSHIQTKLSLGSLLTDFYTDKKFLIFNIACIPWWFLFSQLYVLLPLAFSKKTSSEGDELIIYLVNGLVRISLTLLLLRRIKGFSPLALIIVGHCVLTASYLIPLTNSSTAFFLIMVAVFSIAETLIMPAIDTYISKIAPPGREANYFGIANIPWIIGATIGNMVGAHLLESSNPTTPWILMSVLAISGALALSLFSRLNNNLKT